jgi:hypothetical protein
MSAYDAVDGAHSAASKCNTELKRRWAIQGGERTAGSGIDGMELKVLTNWRGHDDEVDPRIGRTRLGHRIFECVFTIGTRSAQRIMASGHIGRTNRPDT